MHSVEYPVLRAAIRVHHKGECRQVVEISETMLQLARVKERVPKMIHQIGRQRWEKIVNSIKSSTKGPSRIASRAYFKLKEIMLTCVIDPPKTSVHLCESPGGFVQATGDVADDAWQWTALSIKRPGAPMPLCELLPMNRGSFLDADIMNISLCTSLLEARGADFVTADGAFEMTHSNLEEEHFEILLAQTRVGLYALKQHGTLLIKFFEGRCLRTLQYIAWLTTLFESVSIIKPTSSRPTNSERYLIARNYLCEEGDHVDPSNLFCCVTWFEHIQELMDTFAKNQNKALEQALCASVLDENSPSASEMGLSKQSESADRFIGQRTHST